MVIDSLKPPQFKSKTASPACAIKSSGAKGKWKALAFTGVIFFPNGPKTTPAGVTERGT